MRTSESDTSHLYSRFNAHLTFNLLNTVQGLILENNPDCAIELIGTYSRLLRRMLISNTIETRLRDEMDITEDYLEIERIRFDNKFVYDIKIPKALENQAVPKSMIFGLVENAIKHGIRPLMHEGYIFIDCPRSRYRIIRVRNNAPLVSSVKGLGFGLDITHELLDRFNHQTGSLIHMSMNTRTKKKKAEIEFETLIHLSA